MSQTALERLILNWQNNLLENPESLSKLKELFGIEAGKVKSLELGLVKVPSPEDLPARVLKSLKSFKIMDGKYNGMLAMPLRRKTGQVVNFLSLNLNGGDDKVIRNGGLINLKAFKVFKNLVVVDNIKDFFFYYQRAKENVIPLILTDRMQDDFRDSLVHFNTDEITLINDSPFWEYVKEKLKDTGIRRYEISLPGSKSVREYLEERSPAKLIAFIEGEKAKILQKEKEDKSNGEDKKEYLKVTEDVGEIRFEGASTPSFDKAQDKLGTGIDRSYRIRGFSRDSFEKSVQLNLEIEGKSFPDRVDISRIRSRLNFSNMAASEFEISPEIIRNDLAFIYKALDKIQEERYKEKRGIADKNVHVVTLDDMRKAINLLTRRDLLDEILIKDTERLGVIGEEINKKLFFISSMSRLTGKPVSVLDISPPGTGKSFLMSTIIDLMPRDEVLKFSRLTPNSLYYKPEEELRGKVLYIEELVGMEESLESIRMIISAEELAVSGVDKDPKTGQLISTSRRVKAAIPILSSGVHDIFDEETMSRFILTYNDMTEKHRQEILKAQAHKYSYEGEKIGLQRNKFLKRHRDFSKSFKTDIVVINPYSHNIMVNPDMHIVTRKQEHYLRIIYNIAFLRQHSRERQKEADKFGNEFIYITVRKEDIFTANEIMSYVFRFASGDLTKRLYDAYQMIKNYCIEKVKEKRIGLFEYKFSRREIREYASWEQTTAKRLFDELEALEYIRKVKGEKQGMQYLYRLVPYHEKKRGDSDLRLLDPDEL